MMLSGAVHVCSNYVKNILMALLLFSVTAFLSGCLILRAPAEINYVDGAIAESLSSNASLSYATLDKSISGSGFIMYRKPDQMRVVILSPFGSVLQEVYVTGGYVTIIDPGNSVALSGTQMDLPEKGDFSGWRHIHWLIDIDPPDHMRKNAVINRVNKYGQQEKAIFENGLLISKSTETEGIVKYGKYTILQGTAFPLEIIYESVAREKFTIMFEEPEINVPLTDDVFTPNTTKLHVYPLSILK